MTCRLLSAAGLLLAMGFSHPALAQDSPRYWGKDWAYPLAPCVGPLADTASARYNSAYGRALACIDYGPQGEARAVLRYFSNHRQQWLPDVALDAPAGLTGLQVQAVRLLSAAGDGKAEILVLALEYAPSQAQPAHTREDGSDPAAAVRRIAAARGTRDSGTAAAPPPAGP